MTFDPDLRRETPLGAQLKAAIRTLGAITVTDFMSRCLWDDRYGYYRTQQAIGAAGDFITAPELSPLFGRTLARQLPGLLAQDIPDIIELGAGSGTLAGVLLDEYRNVDAASVTAVGSPRATSSAKLGPDRIAVSACGATSATISVMNLWVPRSMPLAQITTGVSAATCGASAVIASRRLCAGVTSRRMSALALSARSPVSRMA